MFVKHRWLAPAPAAAAGGFRLASAELLAPRSRHGVVTLRDGRVLEDSP